MRSQTIMVGLLMLFIGLIVGSVGTAMVMSSQSTEPATAAQDAAVNSENAEPEAAESAEDTQNVPNQAEANQQDMQVLMEQLIADTRHFKGDEDAPVTIIEFSDFRCPYCSKFAMEAGKDIDETYVKNGQVRMGYRHAAYQGEDSLRAAEASECAAAQDAFWPYHDRLVEHVAIDGQRDFTVEHLNQFAEELGLDTEAFNTCLSSGTYQDLVINETVSGQQLVRGTPMFLINGQMISGAQPFAAFQQVIESELGS